MKTLPSAIAWAATALAGVPGHAATYTIDPTHTFVSFEVVHLGISTQRSRFDKKEGELQFDRDGKTGRVDITIDTTSMNTGFAPFNSWLQGPDFFNSALHPSAHFVGERLVFSGDQLREVVGTLTLLGKTLPLTLKARHFNCYLNPLFNREVCGGDFESTLQRSQWGMTGGLAAGLADSVRLLIQVEAIQQ